MRIGLPGTLDLCFGRRRPYGHPCPAVASGLQILPPVMTIFAKISHASAVRNARHGPGNISRRPHFSGRTPGTRASSAHPGSALRSASGCPDHRGTPGRVRAIRRSSDGSRRHPKTGEPVDRTEFPRKSSDGVGSVRTTPISNNRCPRKAKLRIRAQHGRGARHPARVRDIAQVMPGLGIAALCQSTEEARWMK